MYSDPIQPGVLAFFRVELAGEEIAHIPRDAQLEELLPSNWLKTRPVASQTIDSRVA